MELREFLVQAKRLSYAGDGKEKKFSDGCKELRFKQGNLVYIDRYYGFDPFIGEEIVFENKKFIWGMNYYGKIISNKVSKFRVYGFLKKAMKMVSKDMPFRGPKNFKKGNFEYVNKIKGNVDCFSGHEKIYYKGEEIYFLDYFGGLIAPR